MEASVDPQPRGPDWMPITPKTGSLFHAETHSWLAVEGGLCLDNGHDIRAYKVGLADERMTRTPGNTTLSPGPAATPPMARRICLLAATSRELRCQCPFVTDAIVIVAQVKRKRRAASRPDRSHASRAYQAGGGIASPPCAHSFYGAFILALWDSGHGGPWYGFDAVCVLALLGAIVGGSIFVLLVDNDAAFADAAARSFESVGMRTVVALDSMAALDAFDSNAIDVVVTDIKLPAGEPHGMTLARMIENRKPRVPFILMTAHRELLKREIALPGAELCEPLEIAELCRAIRVRLAQ